MLETATTGKKPLRKPRGGLLLLLGPAFVAAIAYVDPGNVAANLTSGASYGYLLVWVLVAANVMAMLVQYQSAKLGVVTGKSLPEILGERFTTRSRRLYWAQAELVAMATDLAEVVGGAIALHLLFQLPLPVGGLIVGLASMVLLTVQNRHGQRHFERIIIFLLVIITIGFLAGLVLSPPDPAGVAAGLIPLRRLGQRHARGRNVGGNRDATRHLPALPAGQGQAPRRPQHPGRAAQDHQGHPP